MTLLKMLWPLLLIAVFGLIAVAIIGKSKAGKVVGQLRAKMPLTKNEQPMYFRLVEALPEHIVLAQVAFSALVTAPFGASRNKFDRKVADFVICTKAFEVVAIIELDDSSHKGKEDKDAERDAMLASAGYKTIRFKKTPDIEEVKIKVLRTQVKKETSFENSGRPEKIVPLNRREPHW